ncbi:MAG: efflux transporter outer membrane subunit [Candidatus Ancaeobacter aquaticus]|nr:efflux transporter outer membrane subunit [Candidatus Ancaeobacter aquaticus]
MTTHSLKWTANRTVRCACFIALSFVFLSLNGCFFRLGPNYAPPQTAVSPEWSQENNNDVKKGPGQYRNWWSAFNDPVLNALIEKAYEENLTLHVAGIRVLQARTQLGIAVGNWFPQSQQANGSLERQSLSAYSTQGLSAPTHNFSQAAIGGLASWEIDFWGKFSRAIESANMSLMSSAADYDNTLVTLIADVASTYVSIRTLQKRLLIAHENVTVQKESLKIAETRFKGGTTSDRDVEQAKTILASTQADIPTIETNLIQAVNLLSTLLGKPPFIISDFIGAQAVKIPTPQEQVAIGIPADLLRRRPDIRQAEYDAAAQCARIGIAKADLLPAFSLNGSLSWKASNMTTFPLSNMWDYNAFSGSMGPSFKWNILNYGRIINNVRTQDALFQEKLLLYQDKVLQAQREVENALTGFVKSQQRASFLLQSVSAAKRSTDLAVIQYQQGMTDFTTVLTAQQELLLQQNNHAVARGAISQNLVSMYRALGGGWEIREGKDFVPTSIQTKMKERTYWGNLLKPKVSETDPVEASKPVIRLPDM